MQTTNPDVGIIKSPATLQVERGGQVVELGQGDALKWNDVVTNTGAQNVEVLMPAVSAGHGDTLVQLAPNASAKLEKIGSAVSDGAMRTEVVALSEGVELYDIDNEISSAVVTPYEGTMSGLVGAGLLAGSSSAAGVGATIGGAALGALALSEGGDDRTATLDQNDSDSDADSESDSGSDDSGSDDSGSDDSGGGDSGSDDSGGGDTGSEEPSTEQEDPLPDTPLDPLTDALIENSDPAVLGQSIGGVVEDIGANTPLEPVTETSADALAGGGNGSGETTPVDDLLTVSDGTPISTATAPLLEASNPITGGLLP